MRESGGDGGLREGQPRGETLQHEQALLQRREWSGGECGGEGGGERGGVKSERG